MKKTILFLLLIYGYCSVIGQSIEREVQASSGDVISNGNFSISFTMGEYTGGILNSNAYTLTQGFQQSTRVLPVLIDLKVLLEGAWNNDTQKMETILHNNSLVPIEQPFNVAPWCYQGTENRAESTLNELVDWLLIEVRDGQDKNNIINRQAVLLKNDGSVEGMSGLLELTDIDPTKAYYIVIRHRNHMDVITPNPIQITDNQLIYSFISNSENDDKLKEINTGVFALYAGDANADALISTQDLNIYKSNAALVGKYNVADFNLDGNITTKDLNLYKSNASTIGASEISINGSCD